MPLSSHPDSGSTMQAYVDRSKRASLKGVFSDFFRLGKPIVSDRVQVSSNSASTSLFANAHNFTVSNSTFNYIGGNRETIAQGMWALSKQIIDGAEHDSSARDPPPRCHPGTRVKLHVRLNTWFSDKKRRKALLWLYGPAGVGKSAVIQTLAESLATSKHLGATLFFSRTNGRRDPQRVFITLAFQLATKIPAYQAHITEQIALNPSLLKKGMQEQFRVFIADPFGKNGIGKDEGTFGILLDGLDECEGVSQQSKIVQLIGEFVLKFPDAPLLWAVASRPEPHIVATFADEAIASNHWAEYIPIDSTEACQDVERYLNASFKALRKRFSHIPSNWPSAMQFLKLSNGALGLFLFAITAVRFMEDPDHADPISRLNMVVSVIDHVDIPVTNEHPFTLLDALYREILMSIPLMTWRTSKRILGFALCARPGHSYTGNGLLYHLQSLSLMGTSIIFGLEQNTVYASLYKLHSVLKIPRREYAHKYPPLFLHASFIDYLKDEARSKDFFIDCGDAVDDITQSLYKLYLDKPWDTNWARYTPELSRFKGRSFYQKLKQDAQTGLYHAATGDLKSKRGEGPLVSQQDRSECLNVLSQVNTADVPLFGRYGYDFHTWLSRLWECFREELENRGLVKRITLRTLTLDHLDRKGGTPTRIRYGDSKVQILPSFHHTPQQIMSELQSLRLDQPNTLVFLCGSTPEKRNAFIRHEYLKGAIPVADYYCIPYPY